MHKQTQKINDVVGECLGAPITDVTPRCECRFVLVQIGGRSKPLPYDNVLRFRLFVLKNRYVLVQMF